MRQLLLHFMVMPLFFTVFLQADMIPNSTLVTKKAYKVLDDKSEPNLPKKRGEYVLASVFGNKEELEWAKRFDIVELGNVEDSKVSYELLEKKGFLDLAHPIAYDWMPALYYYTGGENRAFVEWLYKNRAVMTINPKGPFIHCKENHYEWCQDYYYNLGNEELMKKRVEDLISNMKIRGFRGVFFDWASGVYIEEAAYRSILLNFEKLNPGKSYFDFVSEFYQKLRASNIFVITNQGFRKAEYILPFVQYDMTESYITTDVAKKMKIQLFQKGWVDSVMTTNYYPIYKDSHTLKDSLKFIDLLSGYRKKYKKFGFKNFIYLNYLAPEYEKIYASSQLYKMKKPKNGIYFSYAMAKLADGMVYAEVPGNRKFERDEIYFYDLGHVLGEKYEKLDAIEGYIRFYEKGFVLVSQSYPKELSLKISSKYLKSKKKLYDVYNKTKLKIVENSVAVNLEYEEDQITKDKLPLGRVYLYF
jgi:hypothetical protein